MCPFRCRRVAARWISSGVRVLASTAISPVISAFARPDPRRVAGRGPPPSSPAGKPPAALNRLTDSVRVGRGTSSWLRGAGWVSRPHPLCTVRSKDRRVRSWPISPHRSDLWSDGRSRNSDSRSASNHPIFLGYHRLLSTGKSWMDPKSRFRGFLPVGMSTPPSRKNA